MSVTLASALRPASSLRLDLVGGTWVQAAAAASADRGAVIDANDPATYQAAAKAATATDAASLRGLVGARPIPARLFLWALRLRTKCWRTRVCGSDCKTIGRRLENLPVPPVACRASGCAIRTAWASLVAIAGSWVASASVDR